MSHLERIKERQATLQVEYSPDSGLTYTEFMFSKLVDAEDRLADFELVQDAIGKGISLSVGRGGYIAEQPYKLKNDMPSVMSASSDISHADAIRSLQAIAKREAKP